MSGNGTTEATPATLSGTGVDTQSGNGAHQVIAALLDSNVDVMFANPGTTEMHLVSALDHFPTMRAVPCLFEGVAAGAADGYARMAGRPAATLLHLGAGFGNAWANLHNARRGGSPVVNIVGEHAASHRGLQSPLESDLETLAATVSGWVRRATSANGAAADTRAAVAAAWALHRGQAVIDPGTTATGGAVATLVVPADVSWASAAKPTSSRMAPAESVCAEDDLDPAAAAVAALQSGQQVALLLGAGSAADADLRAADRIRQATGALVYVDAFPTHRRRGSGLPPIADLPFHGEQARRLLETVQCAITLNTPDPVAAFARPGESGRLLPPEASLIRVSAARSSALLTELADAVAPGVKPSAPRASDTGSVATSAPLTAANWGDVFAAVLPENAIISDESLTSGMFGLSEALDKAQPHDSLGQAGYAIGQGIPVATGAAIACSGRPVFNLQADGSALYTITGLWTQAREHLNVTTVILDNGAYAILRSELVRVGAAGSPAGENLISLGRPAIDFVAVARGMGVPGTAVSTGLELHAALVEAQATHGPFLIHAHLDG